MTDDVAALLAKLDEIKACLSAPPAPHALSPCKFADLTGYSKAMIYELVKSKQLPHIVRGDTCYIPVEQGKAALERLAAEAVEAKQFAALVAEDGGPLARKKPGRKAKAAGVAARCGA